MKNLQLIPALHKNQAIVKAQFGVVKDIIALVKTQAGVRWVQSLHPLDYKKKNAEPCFAPFLKI